MVDMDGINIVLCVNEHGPFVLLRGMACSSCEVMQELRLRCGCGLDCVAGCIVATLCGLSLGWHFSGAWGCVVKLMHTFGMQGMWRGCSRINVGVSSFCFMLSRSSVDFIMLWGRC